ncbi:MAG: hypothetical protein ACK5MU_04585 [Candidatus Saccharimonadales bacterium]
MKHTITYEPKKCWVGDQQKVIYPDFNSALAAARLVEYEHGLPPDSLTAYKCEYGGHYHLANVKR